jgi:hypothetical protein
MLVSINNQTGGIINVFNNVSATIHQSNGQQTIDIHSPSSGAIGNNVKKDSTQVSDCQSDSRTQRGRRIQRLFVDEQTAGQEKNRLLNFLHRHNLGSREFDSSEDSSVNQIAVCFYRQWAKRGLLDNKAGRTAYVRFLKYDCELPISVIEKALGNVLSRMINSKQNYPQWSGEISEYFQN